MCRLRRRKDELDKDEQIKLFKLQKLENKLPPEIINEFRMYLIEEDEESKDTLDKVVKRIRE